MKAIKAGCWSILIGLLCVAPSGAQELQTQPVRPQIRETPLPEAITLPAPPENQTELPNRPLTPAEAALIALRHQPDVAAAQASATAAQAKERQAVAGLRPSIGITGSYTRADKIITGNGANSAGKTGYQFGASAEQLLFDYNHTRDLARQSFAQSQSAAHNLTRVQSDLVYRVKQAFYSFQQNQRLVGVHEADLRAQQEHLALAQARLKAGVGLPLDVVRAETAVSTATLNLTLARNNAANARVALALLMGIDPRTPVQTAEAGEADIAADDLNALVEKALAQRPEILLADASLQAAQFGVSAAKTSNAPTLNATLGLSSSGTDLSSGNGALNVGAVLQWSPFDAGLTAGRVQEATANEKSARAQWTSARQAVIAEVSQAYLNLKSATQRLTTADAAIANAAESVRLAEGRYRAGVGLFLDVIDAQAALLSARTDRINAQSALDQARAALAHAVGAPLPTP